MTGKELFDRILKLTGLSPVSKRLMLCYHHIGYNDHDPWHMYVSPENFNLHCRILHQYFTVLPVNTFFSKQEMDSEKPVIYISFDDGYLDNYVHAFPAIKKYQLPITIFLCSKIFTGQKLYWWEIIEDIFLAERILPRCLTLRVREELIQWNLSENRSKSALYFELADILKESTIDLQDQIIRELVIWAGYIPDENVYPKVSKEQVLEMIQSGLVTVGAHTINHPALGNLSTLSQKNEIMEGKTQLEALFQERISTFSYPHGHLNNHTESLVKEAGFTLAFTTEENSFLEDSNVYTLPRIWIHNWGNDQFLSKLHKWI